jgi:cytidyltransferase-like protein
MPRSASSRIANEAILAKAMQITSRKLSVILRTNTDTDDTTHVSLTKLRRYAGEVYSMAWDAALGLDRPEDIAAEEEEGTPKGELLDLIIYPQNMPNTPPEGWISNRPDLSCVISHDSITGWVTSAEFAGGNGRLYADEKGRGVGGLASHVEAMNAERVQRGLRPVMAVHVDDWPDGADITEDSNIVFLEDDDAMDSSMFNPEEVGENNFMGGSSVSPSSLYSSVAVGGTFDGIHYGHRKLLTLAISSVQPVNGKLLIGVTRDEMLRHKAFADRIPPLKERMEGVLEFVGNLAPVR